MWFPGLLVGRWLSKSSWITPHTVHVWGHAGSRHQTALCARLYKTGQVYYSRRHSSEIHAPVALTLPRRRISVTRQPLEKIRGMASEKKVSKKPAQEPGNFSWVEPNVLAACKFPDSVENLQFLVNNNIGCLVTLTGEREVNRGYIKEKKLKIVWIPIRDYTPPTMEQVSEFINQVLETKATGKATCVHCAHGLGRTGTMLACYFVQVHNMEPEAAIAHVRKLRPGSVETPEQELLVTEFYNTLKKT